MLIKNTFRIFIIIFCLTFSASAQTKDLTLTLKDVLEFAKTQSPQALIAKHSFRASYWRYRSHEANYLPSLKLDATIPELNRSISRITLSDGTDAFVERKLMNSLGSVSLTQNIGFTGGSIFLKSDLERIDLFSDSLVTSYMSTPVSIGFYQPILAYNSLKWERKIEPLVYQEAMKNYLEACENISITAISYFFDLALSQLNLKITQTNLSNTDTLYKMSKGRYNIGTIAENDLLQMELSYLNASTNYEEAKLDLEVKKFKLRSFLGFNENVNIELIIPNEIPEIEIDVKKATAEALKNNADIIQYQRQIIEAERDIAKAKAESRMNMNLYALYGLTQSSENLENAYKNPQDQQMVTVGLSIPILDWGLGKGKVRMAKSNHEVISTQVAQNKTDFEQDVFLKVMQFNMQDNQLKIASKADTIAQKRYQVSKERFIIGKISVLDLNTAQSEKDSNQRTYISTLRNFWIYFYNIRRITLYDFEKDVPLQADFDKLLD